MKLDKHQNRMYSVESYNPTWTERFEVIKKLLESVFNEQAVAIEHVGSTAVPNMRAKPVIDVLVVVDKMQQFEDEKEKMVQVGYEWTENYIAPNTLLFYKNEESSNQRFENIHICERDSASVSQFLDIRNFLRLNSEWADKYSTLKEKLQAKYPNDYVAYREGKQDFLNQLRILVNVWKENS